MSTQARLQLYDSHTRPECVADLSSRTRAAALPSGGVGSEQSAFAAPSASHGTEVSCLQFQALPLATDLVAAGCAPYAGCSQPRLEEPPRAVERAVEPAAATLMGAGQTAVPHGGAAPALLGLSIDQWGMAPSCGDPAAKSHSTYTPLLPAAVYAEQAQALAWLQAPTKRSSEPTLVFDPGRHSAFGESAGPEAHRHLGTPIWQWRENGGERWVPAVERPTLALNLEAWRKYLVGTIKTCLNLWSGIFPGFSMLSYLCDYAQPWFEPPVS